MTSGLALTFHGLVNQTLGEELSVDPAAQRYAVTVDLFTETLKRASQIASCTAVEFLKQENGSWTIITFDDGLISDYAIAYPLLRESNLRATFFVTSSNVGAPGYVSKEQIREMSEGGMEIGSHGLTHTYLVDMDITQIKKEITESKDRLEQIIGKAVHSFAPVGGHFNCSMVQLSKDAGYLCFASMIPGVSRKGDFPILRRNHLQADHDELYLNKLLQKSSVLLAKNYLRYQLLFGAKRILGMKRYDRMKNMLLQGNE